MAYAGKIYPAFTHVEIDEQGNIWTIFNFEEESVIEDMQAVAEGDYIVEDAYFPDEVDEFGVPLQ